MLQAALRTTSTSETEHSYAFYTGTNVAVGEQMRTSARSLNEAMGRLEQVITRGSAPSRKGKAVDAEALKEIQALKSKCARLEQENAALKADQTSVEALMGEQEQKNAAVSKQVLDLSVKLETLVARLAKVLEE